MGLRRKYVGELHRSSPAVLGGSPITAAGADVDVIVSCGKCNDATLACALNENGREVTKLQALGRGQDDAAQPPMGRMAFGATTSWCAHAADHRAARGARGGDCGRTPGRCGGPRSPLHRTA